jgi:hypothetical protein
MVMTVFGASSRPQGVNRYEIKPGTSLPGSTEHSGGAADDQALPTPARVTKSMLFRHVEGLDLQARVFDPADIDCRLGRKCEVGDPFGQLLLKTSGHLPRTVNEVLSLLDMPGPGAGDLPVQTVYIVSETGQIPVLEAPQMTRRARAVIVRQNPTARAVVLIAPSMRTDGNGLIEVMGWDKDKKLFNYYERLFASDRPIWVWKGDSSHAWNAKTRDHACFSCHRNGEPVMKELRQPWQNWHSQNASIKPESIPDDSPLKTNPLFSIEPPSQFLGQAEVFEKVIEQWVGKLNRSRIMRYKGGALSVRNILEPLFKSTTINLRSSIDGSSGTGTVIRIPWTFLYNSGALTDAGELVCDAIGAFGQPEPSLDTESYKTALAALKFRIESPGEYFKEPADTHFAFLTPEPAKTDVDLIFNLINERVISRRLAITLTLVDVPNAVYSPMREALFALLPDWHFADVGPGGVDERLVGLFREKQRADDLSELARNGLTQFFALWASPLTTWEVDACARLEYYLKNVGTRWHARDYLPYFRLLGARREKFFLSDHRRLKESELLFPKSETDATLTMQFDGTVR